MKNLISSLFLFLTIVSYSHSSLGINCVQFSQQSFLTNNNAAYSNERIELLLDSTLEANWKKTIDAYKKSLSKYDPQELYNSDSDAAYTMYLHQKVLDMDEAEFRLHVIKDFIEESLRTKAPFIMPKIQNSWPGIGFASRLYLQTQVLILYQELAQQTPDMLALHEQIAMWAGSKENDAVEVSNHFPRVSEKVEGEYWDFATGVISITQSAIKGSDPNRAHRFFDIAPYAVVRLNSLLDSIGRTDSKAVVADLTRADVFAPYENQKLAGIRLKNTTGYVPNFAQHFGPLLEKLEVGGQVHFQFLSPHEQQFAMESFGDKLHLLEDWPVEVTEEYAPFTTYIYTKPAQD